MQCMLPSFRQPPILKQTSFCPAPPASRLPSPCRQPSRWPRLGSIAHLGAWTKAQGRRDGGDTNAASRGPRPLTASHPSLPWARTAGVPLASSAVPPAVSAHRILAQQRKNTVQHHRPQNKPAERQQHVYERHTSVVAWFPDHATTRGTDLAALRWEQRKSRDRPVSASSALGGQAPLGSVPVFVLGSVAVTCPGAPVPPRARGCRRLPRRRAGRAL